MANKTFQNFINWFTGTYQGPQPVTLLDENGNAFDGGNPLPIGTITGASVALVSPPANTNAGSDTVLTFAQKANHFLIQNNTSVTIYIMLDAVSSTAGVQLLPGGIWRDDIPVTSPHIYTVAAQPINAANGILVEGWA